MSKTKDVYLLGLILLFSGNYFLYLKSAKTTHVYCFWEIRLKNSKQFLKFFAPVLITMAGIIFIVTTGFLGGFFFGLFAYLMVAGLTVIIRPLLTPERSKKYAGK